MVADTRTRTPSSQVEQLILDAAATLLEEHGASALSVRRIAAEAGVAPMGVYNHFDSKAGIIDALFRQGFERLEHEMATLNEIDDPLEGLLEGGRRYREMARAHPQAYQMMFLRTVPGFEPSAESKLAALRAFAGLRAQVARALDAGLLEPRDPDELSQMFWATCHGWVALEILGLDFNVTSDPRTASDDLAAALVAGLRPRSAAD